MKMMPWEKTEGEIDMRQMLGIVPRVPTFVTLVAYKTRYITLNTIYLAT